MKLPLIHLDTNYVVNYTSGYNPEAISQLEAWIRDETKLHLSAMVWAEFRCGPLSIQDEILAQNIIANVVPLTKEISDRAGVLFQATRTPLALPCRLHHRRHRHPRATLATLNRDDFTPFLTHGLQLF